MNKDFSTSCFTVCIGWSLMKIRNMALDSLSYVSRENHTTAVQGGVLK